MRTTWTALIVAIFAQAAGDVFLSQGMKSVALAAGPEGAGLFETAVTAATTPQVWLGTVLMMVFFGLYAAVLSWADLSFVLPATAFGYVLNVGCGHFLLGEAVTATRWAGSVLILAGVLLVARSVRRDASVLPEPQGPPTEPAG